jgi:hypothetical protein
MREVWRLDSASLPQPIRTISHLDFGGFRSYPAACQSRSR